MPYGKLLRDAQWRPFAFGSGKLVLSITWTIDRITLKCVGYQLGTWLL